MGPNSQPWAPVFGLVPILRPPPSPQRWARRNPPTQLPRRSNEAHTHESRITKSRGPNIHNLRHDATYGCCTTQSYALHRQMPPCRRDNRTCPHCGASSGEEPRGHRTGERPPSRPAIRSRHPLALGPRPARPDLPPQPLARPLRDTPRAICQHVGAYHATTIRRRCADVRTCLCFVLLGALCGEGRPPRPNDTEVPHSEDKAKGWTSQRRPHRQRRAAPMASAPPTSARSTSCASSRIPHATVAPTLCARAQHPTMRSLEPCCRIFGACGAPDGPRKRDGNRDPARTAEGAQGDLKGAFVWFAPRIRGPLSSLDVTVGTAGTLT